MNVKVMTQAMQENQMPAPPETEASQVLETSRQSATSDENALYNDQSSDTPSEFEDFSREFDLEADEEVSITETVPAKKAKEQEPVSKKEATPPVTQEETVTPTTEVPAGQAQEESQAQPKAEESVDYEAIRQLLGKQKQPEQEPKPSEQQQQPAPTQQVQPEQQIQTQTPTREALREQAVNEVQQNFTLSEDEVEAFRENPNEVFPKMMANIYMDIFDSLMQGMQAQLPTLVQGMVQQQSARQEHQSAFYTVWPQLREQSELVDRIARSYEATNPNVDPLQAIQEIGAQAWIAARMPVEALTAHIAQFTAPPQEPATSPATVSRRPANVSSVPATNRPAQAKALSDFDQFVEEIFEDDMT